MAQLNIKPIILTEEEKINMIPSIVPLIEMCFKVRAEGFFSIQNEIAALEDDLISFIYKLIIGGHNPEIIKSIIINSIFSNNHDDMTRAKATIYANVMFAMNDNSYPVYMLNLLLLSHFGLTFKNKYVNELKKYISKQFIDGLFDNEYFYETE
jgi:hypothetical protein